MAPIASAISEYPQILMFVLVGLGLAAGLGLARVTRRPQDSAATDSIMALCGGWLGGTIAVLIVSHGLSGQPTPRNLAQFAELRGHPEAVAIEFGHHSQILVPGTGNPNPPRSSPSISTEQLLHVDRALRTRGLAISFANRRGTAPTSNPPTHADAP